MDGRAWPAEMASFFRARLGRRIVLLFFACALLPVAAFAAVSYHQVTAQLEAQGRERLRAASKDAGMAILQRLELAAVELRRAAASAAVAATPAAGRGGTGGPPAGPGGGEEPGGRGPERLSWFRAVSLPGADRAAPGAPGPAASRRLAREHRRHLRTGFALLRARPGPEEASILLGVPVDRTRPEAGLAWGTLDLAFLSGRLDPATPRRARATLPAATRLCVVTAAASWGDCPAPLLRARERASGAGRASTATHFRWSEAGGEEWMAARRSLFLRAGFAAPSWDVVVSEPRAHVLAARAGFRRTLGWGLALALLIVLFVSQVQIRRNLEPLARLREGTSRIARREFDSRVQIHSGDEFEDLARSFNDMAGRLGRQFGALTAANEIDRAILGALDADRVVETVLARAPALASADAVCVALFDGHGGGTAAVRRPSVDGSGSRRYDVDVPRAEGERLASRPEGLALGPGDQRPGCIPTGPGGTEASWWLVLPIVPDGEPAGAVAFGSDDRPLAEEDSMHARQLADRVAVALSNARLVEELGRLNVETLTAFARAIDAKSAWTAGHSERVTAVSLSIARELGLPEDELELLRRGGLLHDIGKIGIPGAVLDKPGRLTEEEMEVMRSHTVIGARIVQPISGFRRAVPIVRHHHERFDGGGYPDGLSGEEIALHARIVSVADVYDALTSARPYRPPSPPRTAAAFIAEQAAAMFDPAVVDAFLRAMEAGAIGAASSKESRRSA